MIDRFRGGNSLTKGIPILVFIMLFIIPDALFAQVIHNTGATISVASNTFVGAKDVENSTGSLGNDGTINLDGYLLNGGSINGDGFYNLKGNWTDNGLFYPGASTVTLYGTSDQTITHNSSGETFFNLTINNPGNTITQIANAGSTLGVLNDLNLTAGTLNLHSTTSYLTVGGKAVIDGSLIYNFATTQTASITGALSGAGTINMIGGNLPHFLNLGGPTNEIGSFLTGPGASTVNYNGTVPTQTVFAAPNYRNLIISNSGIKTLQGNSIVGIDLTISGGTFDLGTTTTALSVYGNTSIIGSLGFNGTSVKTVSLTGNLTGSGSIDMSGGNMAHLMNLSGATNSIGSYTSGAGSLVNYLRNDVQTVFSSNNYRHLTISGSGTKTLLYGDAAASGILRMEAGDINANGNILKLTNSAIAALVRSDGKVIGKFQRAIGVTGSEYLYPLGAGAIYNPLKMTFQNLVPGPLTAQFKPEDIGTTGLPIDDDGNEIWNRYITGFWTLTAVAPMATSSFDVNLNHTGFGVVDASASVIKRTNGGNLVVDGEHGTLSASEITRTVLVNGISSGTTDLAIGKGRPRINAQPQNIDICELSNAFFEVTARGRGTLTYLWEVNTGSGWATVTNMGVYSGATTDKLILTGAPYTMNGYLYRCTITDAQGHPNTTSTVLLTVNKIPIAIASPMTQNECPGIAFTDIVLGTSNSVTGTTFAWSRTNPAGITTNLGLTGSAINDKITGTFTNTLDAPVTVTFTIRPTGPGTTFCIGNPIYVNVVVNPTAKVFPIPANRTQCDSLTTSILLASPSSFTSGSITFKYTVTATGSVSGYTASVSGLPNNHTIADKLVNHTDVYQIVTYRVVPVSPVACADGPAVEIKVTVNPTPRVIPVNLQPAICNGGATQIVLTSPTVMTSGAMWFDYTVSVTDGTVSGDMSPENDRIPGYNIARTYQNSSDDIKSVFFSITPKVSNAICVPGPKVVSEVKVHAIPLQDIVVVKPLTCSGGPGLAELRAVISNGASPYHIVWTGPVGYHSEDLLDIADLSSGKYIVKVTDNLGCSAKDSINIIPKSATAYISAVIIPPGNYNVSCIGSTDGKILVSVTGGITPPYTYRVIKDDVGTLFTGVFTNNLNLSNPTTYHYYENLGSGTYTLIINDVNGCENIAKVTLKAPPVMVVGFGTSTYSGGYNVTCKGYNDGSAWVNTITGGRGTYTYRWYTINGNIPGPVNTNRIDNLIAGKYYLETKDILNCVKIDSVVITEPEGMVLESSQLSVSADRNYNISCNGGNDGFINMSISGGSGDYTYIWSSPNGFTATTKDISELKAGDYSCTVTDYNGCILTPTPAFTLTEPDPLVIVSTSSVSNDGAFNINCNGGKGSIQVTVTGGSVGSYVYTWTTTGGSGLIDGVEDQNSLSAGTYHLVVTDANNCVTTKDIILTQPPPFSLNISATNITCISPDFSNGAVDLTVSGGVGPFTYTWSNGAGTEDIDGLTEGDYQVTVTYNNTCSKAGTASIELPPPLTYSKIISDYNGYSISCNGLSNGSIEITPITGEAPFTYSWTGPDGFTSSSKDISNLRAGEYILLITDSNFCTAAESFDLTEPGILGMNFDLSTSNDGAYNISCAGDRTGAIGIEPLNHVKTAEYLWADGVFGKTRINLPAGTYNVIITDANNCHAGSTVILTEPDSLKIVFDVTQPFCPDKPDGEIRLNVTGGVRGTDYTYKWSDNSNGKTNSDIPGGLFSVRVSDLNGCMVKDSIIVKPLHETCLIIPNAISPNDDLINDEWNIGMIELYPQMEIKIFNRWGEIIWRSEKGYPRPWDGRSNGADLPIDSYHYIIDLHNGSRPIVGNVTIVR